MFIRIFLLGTQSQSCKSKLHVYLIIDYFLWFRSFDLCEVDLQRTRPATWIQWCVVLCCLLTSWTGDIAVNCVDWLGQIIALWAEGKQNSRESGKKTIHLSQWDLKDPFAPPPLLLSTCQVSHCFGIVGKQHYKVESGRLLLVSRSREISSPSRKENLLQIENWNQKADQGSGQCKGLALPFVSLTVWTFPLLWSLCLSSKICLLSFSLCINGPILQSKCQKELVQMTLLNHIVPLGSALGPRHLLGPLAGWWTGRLRPVPTSSPLSDHWCTGISPIWLSWSGGLGAGQCMPEASGRYHSLWDLHLDQVPVPSHAYFAGLDLHSDFLFCK